MADQAVSEVFAMKDLIYPVVVVRWHDAWSEEKLDPGDVRRSVWEVVTTGFLVEEDAYTVSIAQSLDGDGTWGHVQNIRRVMIVEGPVTLYDEVVEAAIRAAGNGSHVGPG